MSDMPNPLQCLDKFQIRTERIHCFGMLPVERHLNFNSGNFVVALHEQVEIVLRLEGRLRKPRSPKRSFKLHLQTKRPHIKRKLQLESTFVGNTAAPIRWRFKEAVNQLSERFTQYTRALGLM